MARTDTLNNFLTDVADAIRTKTGSTAPITASDFDTEIENIPTGGDPSQYFDGNFKDSNLTANQFVLQKYFKSSPVAIDCTGKTDLTTMFQTSYNSMQYVIPHLINVDAVTNISSLCSNHETDTAIACVTDLNNAPLVNVSNAFSSCKSVTELDTSGWSWTTITNVSNLFAYCQSMTSCPGFLANATLTINKTNIVNAERMFIAAQHIRYTHAVIDLPNCTNCENLLNMTNQDCGDHTKEVVVDINAPLCSNFTMMCAGIGGYSDTRYPDYIHKLTVNFQNYKVTSMRTLGLCSSVCAEIIELKNLNPSTYAASNAQCNSMFAGNYNDSVKQIIFTNCNFNNAQYFNSMFQQAQGLTTIDLSQVCSACNPVQVNNMFYNCRALTHLDVRGFNFTLITSSGNYQNMLYGVPATCEIIVKDAANKTWFNTNFPAYTNVMTAAEYEAQ